MADCFGVSIDYLACGEKAAVVSVDGLTDEQINLMTELTRALRQQNKGRRGNPKSTPTPERQELVFKRVAQFLKECSDDTGKGRTLSRTRSFFAVVHEILQFRQFIGNLCRSVIEWW